MAQGPQTMKGTQKSPILSVTQLIFEVDLSAYQYLHELTPSGQ